MPAADRFALLSHTLPPSPSVHAMVLERLLDGLPPERYCLIRSGADDGGGPVAGPPDPVASRYALRPPFRQGILSRFDLELLSVSVNAFFAIRSRAAQVAKILKKERCRLLIACTGDLHDLPAACLASRWAGIPFVPYVLDDYSRQWTGSYRAVALRLEPIVMRRAAVLIVPNEFLEREYAGRYGVKCVVIRNPCPIPDLARLDAAPPVFDGGGVDIVFTGTVYHAHYDAFHNLIAAIGRLGRKDVRLHVYTTQPETHLAKAGVSGPAVIYHPRVDPSEVPRILRKADILFLPLAFDSPIREAIRTSAPGKTGEYLAAGRPILVHAPPDSFLSWYFRENRCGLVVDRNSAQELADGIVRLESDPEAARELSRAAREAAERDFAAGKTRAAFEELLGSVGARRPIR